MKILTVIGARPQFIKAAVVSREIQNRKGVIEHIIHTGQHYDKNMSDVFFEEMDIPKPKYHLDINSMNHGAMTGRMLEKIEEIFIAEKPDIVLVYGDTNSTLAGALAAIKHHIPIAHVEAGLRSFNKKMPEEINRVLTDQMSNILFCPTDEAVKNLNQEGYNPSTHSIIKSGDVMLDASMYYAQKARFPKSVATKLKKSKYILCTIHRPENTDNFKNLEEIFKALNELTDEIDVILPLHPRTRKIIGHKINLDKLIIIDPVSYFEMIGLILGSHCILTDSGGLQKEAFFFKKVCITLRDQTEWLETLSSGCNKLTGADYIKIMASYRELTSQKADFSQPFYGDGQSARVIVDAIIKSHL